MTTDSNNSINHTDAISPSATREVSQPNSSTPSHSNSSTKKKNGRLKGNLCMLIAKTFSGINQNALKYLLPNWMNAYTGVVLRLGFGSIFFWILGWVRPQKENKMTNRDRLLLLGAGVVFVFGFMWTFLLGLTYTTPISSSIFICLQAAVVYLITLCLRTDRFSWGRFAGIILGIGGALVIILTQKHSATASNPLLGNLLSLLSTFLFGSYLVTEKIYFFRWCDSRTNLCADNRNLVRSRPSSGNIQYSFPDSGVYPHISNLPQLPADRLRSETSSRDGRRPLFQLDSHSFRYHKLCDRSGPVLMVAAPGNDSDNTKRLVRRARRSGRPQQTSRKRILTFVRFNKKYYLSSRFDDADFPASSNRIFFTIRPPPDTVTKTHINI